MTKNWRLPVILTIVLAGLAAIAYWDEWQTKKDEATKQAETKIFNFKPEQVTAFTLENAEDKDASGTIALQKNDGQWHITAPISSPALQDEVNAMLKNIADFSYEKIVATSADRWRDFGLTPARVKITMTVDQKPITFYLGAKAPVGYSAYVAKDGDPNVYMGSQYIDLAVSKKLFDVRAKTFTQLDPATVTQLRVTTGKGASVVLKKDADQWIMTDPAAPIDQGAVRSYLEALKTESVGMFIDKPSATFTKAFTPKNPASAIVAKLEWATQDGQTRTVTVVKNNDEVLAAFDPTKQIFRLNDGAAGRIAKQASDFRDKHIVKITPEQVEKLVVDGKTYVLKNNEWTKLDSDEKAPHLAGFLTALRDAKTDMFDTHPKDLGTPQHTISLYVTGNDQPTSFKAWLDKTNGQKVWLQSSHDNKQIFHTDKNLIEALSNKTPTGGALPLDQKAEAPPQPSQG